MDDAPATVQVATAVLDEQGLGDQRKAEGQDFLDTDHPAKVDADVGNPVQVEVKVKECGVDAETTSTDSCKLEKSLNETDFSESTDADHLTEVGADKSVEVEAEVKTEESEADAETTSTDCGQLEKSLNEIICLKDNGHLGDTSEPVEVVESGRETEALDSGTGEQLISAIPGELGLGDVQRSEAKGQVESMSDSGDPDQKPICAICPKVGVNHCKKCGKVNYCCKEHQVQDWRAHRGNCFPFETREHTMADGQKQGRYMFATRDIAKGEKLLTEKPLLYGPKSRYPSEVICLGCCSKISDVGDPNSINVPCTNCQWMVCGPDCEKIPTHSEFECKLFKKMDLNPETNTIVQAVAMYDSITVLRILLLKGKDEAKFNLLTNIKFDEIGRRRANQSRYSNSLPKQFLRELCGVTEFSDEILEHVFDTVKSNCAALMEISPGQNSTRYMSIFFEHTSVFAPCCISNMRWVILQAKGQAQYSITTAASVDIKKGEMLSGEFTHYMTGTQLRRKVLCDQFFYNCVCRRCSDATELGTFTSGLKCLYSNCKAGYYVAEQPLRSDSDFLCDKCGDRISADKVVTIINIVARTLDQACNIYADLDESEDEEAVICELEKQIKSLRNKVLHPNHYLIVKTAYSICMRFMNVVAVRSAINVKQSLAERALEYCKSSLEMANIFQPGHSRTRGRILYVLQLCMGIIVIVSINGKTTRLTDAVRRYRKRKLDEVVAVQEECLRILEFEPNGTEEHIIRLTLKNQMVETQEVLRTLYVKPLNK